MKNRNRAWTRPLAASLAGLAIGTLLLGCGGEPEPTTQAPQVTRPSTPPPPPKPSVTPVEDLMARHGIDERITLPEDKAPNDDQARVAVLEFFDAFARGDATSLRGMLRTADARELDDLIESGDWDKTVEGIDEILVETGDGPYGERCALGVFVVGNSFQPQLWYYQSGTDGYRFDAAPCPPNMINKLYSTDWITVWHKILEEEIALANKPDQELEPPERRDGGRSGGSRSGGGSRPGLAPTGPGGPPPPIRRPPGPGSPPPG
jgi:hypothetical protein